jgi:hypothetical protein
MLEFTRRDSFTPGYTHKSAVADGQTGDFLRITSEQARKGVSCTMIAGACSGKFQVTTSPDANVDAGTAVWQDWPKGSVTGTDSDLVYGPITALRAVSVSGAITFEVVAA